MNVIYVSETTGFVKRALLAFALELRQIKQYFLWNSTSRRNAGQCVQRKKKERNTLATRRGANFAYTSRVARSRKWSNSIGRREGGNREGLRARRAV